MSEPKAPYGKMLRVEQTFVFNLVELRLALAEAKKAIRQLAITDARGQENEALWDEFRSTSEAVRALESAEASVDRLMKDVGPEVMVRPHDAGGFPLEGART